MMSLWDALRMNMMISYQELVRTFPKIHPHEILTAAIRNMSSFKIKLLCSSFLNGRNGRFQNT